jgi:hypothetical protein
VNKTNIIQRLAQKIPGGIKKADLASFFVMPLLFIVLVFVLAVLILAWQKSQPILSTTANAFGLPVTGSAIHYQNGSAVFGVNQTTYLNIGSLLYSWDLYLPIIFFFVLLSISLSTLLLAPNPISWMVSILIAPFVYYINVHYGNFAYQIFTQAVLQNATAKLPQSITVMSQLSTITAIFIFLWIICLGVRIFFYSPAQSRQASQELQQAMERRGIQ